MNVTYPRGAKEADCRFCALLGGAQDSFSSIWLEDDAFKALVSVGSFIPGWALICPVTHAVNLVDYYNLQDFWDFASHAAHIVKRRYGTCAMFEHGAARETSLTGCGVGHAHGHLVPLNFSLEDEARKFAPELTWTECRAKDVKILSDGKEYLFAATSFNGAETRGIICVLETPTSQFFRQVIASRLGIGGLYDYKKYPMLEMARASAFELRECASDVVSKA